MSQINEKITKGIDNIIEGSKRLAKEYSTFISEGTGAIETSLRFRENLVLFNEAYNDEEHKLIEREESARVDYDSEPDHEFLEHVEDTKADVNIALTSLRSKFLPNESNFGDLECLTCNVSDSNLTKSFVSGKPVGEFDYTSLTGQYQAHVKEHIMECVEGLGEFIATVKNVDLRGQVSSEAESFIEDYLLDPINEVDFEVKSGLKGRMKELIASYVLLENDRKGLISNDGYLSMLESVTKYVKDPSKGLEFSDLGNGFMEIVSGRGNFVSLSLLKTKKELAISESGEIFYSGVVIPSAALENVQRYSEGSNVKAIKSLNNELGVELKKKKNVSYLHSNEESMVRHALVDEYGVRKVHYELSKEFNTSPPKFKSKYFRQDPGLSTLFSMRR